MVKQLKNRYNDPTLNKRFLVGIDRAKMRLFDCEQDNNGELVDANQEVMEKLQGDSTSDKFAKLNF